MPQEETLRLVDLLEQCGAEVTIHWAAGGHELMDDDVEAAKAWLSRLQGPKGSHSER